MISPGSVQPLPYQLMMPKTHRLPSCPLCSFYCDADSLQLMLPLHPPSHISYCYSVIAQVSFLHQVSSVQPVFSGRTLAGKSGFHLSGPLADSAVPSCAIECTREPMSVSSNVLAWASSHTVMALIGTSFNEYNIGFWVIFCIYLGIFFLCL